MPSSRPLRTVLVLGITVSLALTACSGDDIEKSTPTTPAPTATVTTREADGKLRFGLLAPLTDPAAPFGPDLAPIAESLVEIMNTYGGYLDTDIELVIRDEGGTPEEATAAARQLIEDGVDAVVGPFSHFDALAAVPELVKAGRAVCSPSASSSTLDYLDDGGLFIRTATKESDVLTRMVDMAVQSGNEEVSLTYPDDPYGRNLVRELKTALTTRGLTVITEVPYLLGAEDYRSVAFRLTADDAPVELLVTDPANGSRVLEDLIPEAEGSVIITNDGTIDADVTFDPAIPEDSRPRIFGAAPDTRLGSDILLDVFSFTTVGYLTQLTDIPSFTMNMVDCFALIWLTALTAASDDATVFQEEFLNVANDGSRCSWLFDCSFFFDRTLNLDYEGVTSLTLDDLGNAVDRGTVIFTFDSAGRAVVVEGPLDFTLTASDFDLFRP